MKNATRPKRHKNQKQRNTLNHIFATCFGGAPLPVYVPRAAIGRDISRATQASAKASHASDLMGPGLIGTIALMASRIFRRGRSKR